MLDHQITFTNILTHLRQQGRPAITEAQCAYRTPEGLKCGVGFLIPDKNYTPNLEGKSAGENDVRDAIPHATASDTGFLSSIHDDFTIEADPAAQFPAWLESAAQWDLTILEIPS